MAVLLQVVVDLRTLWEKFSNVPMRKELFGHFKRDLADLKLQEILFPQKSKSNARILLDCENIHKEMAKTVVTLSLLWYEYCEECRQNKEIPYSYRQFCRFYTNYTNNEGNDAYQKEAWGNNGSRLIRSKKCMLLKTVD
jgi:hypothetical protein